METPARGPRRRSHSSRMPRRITPIQSIDGEVEFRNLTFAFDDAVVLRGVSFRVPKGTTTAIVGATGSGKSTLLNLLPRLHEPPRGRYSSTVWTSAGYRSMCSEARSGS